MDAHRTAGFGLLPCSSADDRILTTAGHLVHPPRSNSTAEATIYGIGGQDPEKPRRRRRSWLIAWPDPIRTTHR